MTELTKEYCDHIDTKVDTIISYLKGLRGIVVNDKLVGNEIYKIMKEDAISKIDAIFKCCIVEIGRDLMGSNDFEERN